MFDGSNLSDAWHAYEATAKAAIDQQAPEGVFDYPTLLQAPSEAEAAAEARRDDMLAQLDQTRSAHFRLMRRLHDNVQPGVPGYD